MYYPKCHLRKLPLPPRVKTFIWRVAHSRLMTNATRKERGISDSDTCPRCLQHPETIMHVLRDCKSSLELWEKIVDPGIWHKLASLGFLKWLELNFTDDFAGVGNWHWPMVFCSLIHMLWIDRNHYIFFKKFCYSWLYSPQVICPGGVITGSLSQP